MHLVWDWNGTLFDDLALVIIATNKSLALAGAEAALLAGLLMLGTVLLTGEASIASTDAVLLATVVAMQGALLRVWRAARVPQRAGRLEHAGARIDRERDPTARIDHAHEPRGGIVGGRRTGLSWATRLGQPGRKTAGCPARPPHDIGRSTC